MNTVEELLTSSELIAIKKIKEYANQNKQQTLVVIKALLKRYRLENLNIDTVIYKLFHNKKITINFHPDFITNEGKMVIENLLHEGVYHNQFITRISNGHLSAQSDNNRDIWENKIFGLESPLSPLERPKYGALNLFNYLDGASPKYGSCYFELNKNIHSRCTFLIADMREDMRKKGTSDSFYILMLAIMLEIIKTKQLFGKRQEHLSDFFNEMIDNDNNKTRILGANILDYGIETHIFGELNLLRDVDSIYIDYSYEGTIIQQLIYELTHRYQIKVAWIPERRVSVERVIYQHESMALVELIKTLHAEMPFDYINACILGKIRKYYHDNQKQWEKYGDSTQWNRYFKKLWQLILTN